MGYVYAVLGAGRQGTAAAYDLAKNGNADKVLVADVSMDTAQRAALRVNALVGKEIARAAQLDVKEPAEVVHFLRDVNAFVSAVPFYLNYPLAQAAIGAGASMCDLGGNTGIVLQQLGLDEQARQAGVTIVPDCGMVPGLGTSVCVHAMSLVEKPRDVFLWDGGLPQHPREPWNYILTFHFEGLINEYFGEVEFLRDGRLAKVACFEEYELVNFPEPIGELEAFTTTGGSSTAPRTFLGKLRTYQNKTLRYKGHFAQWKPFQQAGLFETEPVTVKGQTIRPRDVLEAALDPKIRAKAGEKDVCIIRCKVVGEANGKPAEAVVDLFDYYDDVTGFTAMERTTGWHASIMAILMARGEIREGAVPVELAVPGKRILDECVARGMKVTERVPAHDAVLR